MKKLFAKDRENRKNIKQLELEHFILKQISTNSNLLKPIRWNALYKLSNMPKKSSKTVISNRCVQTINKKTFSKFTNFSRTVYLKLVKSGYISGMRKSSW
jgi:ribosomal protein S14